MRYCIGIDLGGTFIKFGLLDEQRRVGETFQLPTPEGEGGEGVIRQMTAGVRQLMEQRKLSADDVLGVGIGAPGPLDIERGIVHATPNIPGMENVPLRDRVSEGVHLPGALENDANAAALGEYVCGAGKGTRGIVLLTLGTGVGSGIVIDGKLLHGCHGIGAELGHMLIVPEGEQCACGQRGCLEAYCSAMYLAKLATRAIREEGRQSALAALLDQEGEIDAKDINDARRAGDELAAELWDQGAYYLAIGCVSICRIFDPDKIVLAGGMTKAGGDLMQPVLAHFRRLHWKLTEPQTEIVFSSLGNDAGVIGAAAVAWSAFGGGQ